MATEGVNGYNRPVQNDYTRQPERVPERSTTERAQETPEERRSQVVSERQTSISRLGQYIDTYA